MSFKISCSKMNDFAKDWRFLRCPRLDNEKNPMQPPVPESGRLRSSQAGKRASSENDRRLKCGGTGLGYLILWCTHTMPAVEKVLVHPEDKRFPFQSLAKLNPLPCAERTSTYTQDYGEGDMGLERGRWDLRRQLQSLKPFGLITLSELSTIR